MELSVKIDNFLVFRKAMMALLFHVTRIYWNQNNISYEILSNFLNYERKKN